MVNTVGHRETELALQLGHLYSPEEAKRAGLVDELAPMDQIMARAHVEMDRWIQIPGTWKYALFNEHHIDGLVQERRNSIANALELRLSCTNPSICWNERGHKKNMFRFIIG